MGSIREKTMALEQVFKCPLVLSKLRDGPLGGLTDGFCDTLLQGGFAPSTVRKHLSNISHLNAYIGSRNQVDGQMLSAQTIREFLRHYPSRARNRGSLGRHIAGVKASVNLWVPKIHATLGR
jgi:site-specific recombinase XerD